MWLLFSQIVKIINKQNQSIFQLKNNFYQNLKNFFRQKFSTHKYLCVDFFFQNTFSNFCFFEMYIFDQKNRVKLLIKKTTTQKSQKWPGWPCIFCIFLQIFGNFAKNF